MTEIELSERAYDYYGERFGHDGEIRYANGSSLRFKVIELIREVCIVYRLMISFQLTFIYVCSSF